MNILQYNTKDVFGSKDKSILHELGEYIYDFDIYNSRILNSIHLSFNLLKSYVMKNKIDLFFWWYLLERKKIFLSKILQIPSLLMTAGFEVCSEPSIKYGFDFLPKEKQDEIKYLLNNADLIMFPSKMALNSAKTICDNDNYTLNYNGIDTDLFRQYPIEKRDQIITVGFLESKHITVKGYHHFIEVIPLVRKEYPEIKFTILGSLVDKLGLDILLKLRAKFEVQNNLDIITLPLINKKSPDKALMFKNNQLIVEKLNESKIYLQLSAHESFGMAMAEAMSCEVPVIGTNRGAIPEVLGLKENIVEFGDIHDIANKTLDLLSNPKKRKTVGTTSRKRIIKRFSRKQRKERFRRILSLFSKQSS